MSNELSDQWRYVLALERLAQKLTKLTYEQRKQKELPEELWINGTCISTSDKHTTWHTTTPPTEQ